MTPKTAGKQKSQLALPAKAPSKASSPVPAKPAAKPLAKAPPGYTGYTVQVEGGHSWELRSSKGHVVARGPEAMTTQSNARRALNKFILATEGKSIQAAVA